MFTCHLFSQCPLVIIDDMAYIFDVQSSQKSQLLKKVLTYSLEITAYALTCGDIPSNSRLALI